MHYFFHLRLHRELLAFFWRQLAFVKADSDATNAYSPAEWAMAGDAEFYFYAALITLRNLQLNNVPPEAPVVGAPGRVPLSADSLRPHGSLGPDPSQAEQIARLQAVHQAYLRHWMEQSGDGCKWLLVDAETCRVMGDKLGAMDRYDQAIASAQAQNCLLDAALANELAAHFFLDWGKATAAAGYMQAAYRCYSHWGDDETIAALEQHHGDLLHPILQHQALEQYTQALETEIQEHSTVLQENEERLRLALSAANQGFFDIDLRTDEVVVSPEYAQMLGYEPAIFHETVATWRSRLHPDDQALTSRAYQAYAMGETPQYKTEFRLRTRQGDWKWILSMGTFVAWDAEGNPTRLLGTHTDISDLKQAEAERLQAEQVRQELVLLEQILENVLAGYWDWDIPSQQEYLSPRFKQMFGYEDHELSNTPQTWQDLMLPEDVSLVLDCFERHVQSHGETPFYNEVRYRRKDGSIVWVICSGLVIEWDEAGNPLRMIGCHIDISDRKQAEVELEASQTYYQDIVADQTELICRFLPDGTLTFVNDAYCQFFQKTAVELLGHPFAPLIPKADQDIPLQLTQSLSLDQPVGTCEHRVIAPDGTICWQQWTDRALFSPDGNFIEFQAVGRDITALKEAEATIQRQLRTIEASIDGIAILKREATSPTPTCRYTYLNQSHLDLFGYDQAKELLGQPWQILYPSEEIHRFRAEVFPQVKQQGFWRGEAIGKRRDHTLFPLEISLTLTATGDIIRVCRDIRERKQAEAQIQQSLAQLEISNRELEAFAYSVSHDLRAPLRAIDGFSRVLLEDYEDAFDDIGKDYFDRIRKNVARMGTLIDDLLSLSRVARAELRPATVNLSTLVQTYVDERQALEPDRQVEITIVPNAVVSADPTLMQVVVTNLLDNAWKFTSHRPIACIEFGCIDSAAITSPANTAPSVPTCPTLPTYYVRDNGVGFDIAYAHKLFGVFQRLHAAQEFSGTGIGLATVQRIIHRHMGSVWAEGAIEQGATFYFTLSKSDSKPN